MKKYGKDVSSEKFWSSKDEASEYSTNMINDYHSHRLKVIRSLTPDELYEKGRCIFDFGCGDAVGFLEFLDSGSEIVGVDISHEMVELARQKLASSGFGTDLVKIGSVDSLAELESQSLDALLCFNVLAYLNDVEESLFYQHAQRIVKRGGYLIVTHSNELFDLFSLNEYTANFFDRNFNVQKNYKLDFLSGANAQSDVVTYNVRENPLAYKCKLDSYGFRELKQEYINYHPRPPFLITEPKAYIDTLSVPDAERWKLMFMCSTFGSLSQRM